MNTTAIVKDGVMMERKIVSISSKRQITIPQKYFSMLGFSDEAECILRDNEIIIRPACKNSGGEFSEYILEELISEGFSGKELLDEFKARQRKVRSAAQKLIEDAGKAARGESEYYSYNDVFGSED